MPDQILQEDKMSDAEQQTPPSQSEPARPVEVDPDGEYWKYCARCGHELHNHKCKLICPTCGYFMSCSDFD